MKKLTLMLAGIICLTGCVQRNPEPNPIRSTSLNYTATIPAYDGNGEVKIFTYIIDSCEYVGFINMINRDILTHKGNCKFCIERNKHQPKDENRNPFR